MKNRPSCTLSKNRARERKMERERDASARSAPWAGAAVTMN